MKPGMLLVFGLAAVPLLPWLLFGYAGYDLFFHASSWLELNQHWRSGILAPHWSDAANYFAGEPRFLFYPPLSMWLGAALSLMLPFRVVPAALVWLTMLVAGASMYRASGRVIRDGRQRLAAACLYMLSPYLLMNVVVRFAVAELLYQAMLPLLLVWFHEAIHERIARSALFLVVGLALGWLTDVPLSIIVLYTLAAASLIETIRARDLSQLALFGGLALAALGLAAFRLLPVYFEKRWISPDALAQYDFRDYLIFSPISHMQSVGRLVGLCHWAIALFQGGLAAWCLWKARHTARSTQALPGTLVAVTQVSLFFQLPLSTPLWLALPQLRLVQFPFRFLAILGTAVIIIYVSTSAAWKRAVLCGMGVLAVLPVLCFLQIDRHFSLAASAVSARVQAGYIGKPEYLPPGMSEQSVTTLAAVPPVHGNQCEAAILNSAPEQRVIRVHSAKDCAVTIRTFYFPFWIARDSSGRRLAVEPSPNHLIVVTAPAGNDTIDLRFEMPLSAVRAAGIAISGMTALILLAMSIGLPLRHYFRMQTAQAET